MRLLRLALLVPLGLGLAACGDDDPASTGTDDTTGSTSAGEATTTTAAAASDLSGTVTVFAAASLTDAFGEIETAFEDANPEVDVVLNLAGSSALREQILADAPADVFASANLSNMTQVVDAGRAEGPEVFVTNELQIAVPPGNEAGVDGLDDFADADLAIGLCAEEVPCGQFGREALTAAGVTPSVDTDAPDVRALLTLVETGELDAGIVYRTDVLSAGDAVEGVDIPADQNVVAEYPIAALTEAPNPDAAAAFVAFVLGEEGRSILAAYGFGDA